MLLPEQKTNSLEKIYIVSFSFNVSEDGDDIAMVGLDDMNEVQENSRWNLKTNTVTCCVK